MRSGTSFSFLVLLFSSFSFFDFQSPPPDFAACTCTEITRHLEASRMEELEALLLMAEELKLAVEDGSLVGNHPALRSLVEAMDEVGMSAADTSASTPSSSMSGISGVGRTH